MFPHARNSLRQSTTSNRNSRGESPKHKRIPIPIGVSLHNVMNVRSSPLTDDDTTSNSLKLVAASATSSLAGKSSTQDSIAGETSQDGGGSQVWEAGDDSTTLPLSAASSLHGGDKNAWFRPQHELSLIPRLTLEIWVDYDPPMDDSNNNKVTSGSESPSTPPRGAPTGDGMNDDLSVSTPNTPSRLVFQSPSPLQSFQPGWEHLDERLDLPDQWWRHDRVYSTMRLRILQETDETFEGPTMPPIASDEIMRTDDLSPGRTSTTIVVLEAPMYPPKLERLPAAEDGDSNHIPDSLPPNACLMYYSDGSTRVTSSLFALLLDSQLVSEHASIEDFSRFEDDVFRTLDGVPETPNRPRLYSASALLVEEEPPSTNNAVSTNQEEADLHADELMDEFDAPPELQPEPPEASNEETALVFADTCEEVEAANAKAEYCRLQALIAREEELLEVEVASLEEERENLVSSLEEAKTMERHIQLLRAETKNQELAEHRDLFQKEAQQMKLLRELETIYPITLDSKKGYMIRNLRLPVDIYTTGVPEDEVSAALGFCCHLIAMLSKYLICPLRYKLVCNSSRSAIQLGESSILAGSDGSSAGRSNGQDSAGASLANANIRPLFMARSVEREQLDQGLKALGANVDGMLISHGITFTPNSHILARVQRIFDHVLKGEIPH